MSDEKPEVVLTPKDSLTVDGKKYKLGRLGLPEISQLLIWIKKRQPDPITQVLPYIENLEPILQKHMLDRAVDALRRPVTVDSLEFKAAIISSEGLTELAWMSLQKAGHTAIDRAAIEKAISALSIEDVGRVIIGMLGHGVL